jgi:SAM-dependent methyltransferase
MTAYIHPTATAGAIDAAAWQESWDRQQEAFLPDREERFAAMLDTVDAVGTATAGLRVLDLAGGTGSISLRVHRRFPDAVTTLVDVDPVLLAIARASMPERATVVAADLRAGNWTAALPHQHYDAALTATALHWLPADRLAELYREVRDVLRPGGVFVNADHMLDGGLPGLTERLAERARARREARWAAGAVLSWDGWWERAAADPALGPLVAERDAVFGRRGHTESDPPVTWHLDALRAAGYAEVGLIWRRAADAAFAAVR